MAKTATAAARKPVANVRAKPTGEIVSLPVRGKNEPNLLAESTILSNVKHAFADYDSSGKLEGSATQRLAYAVHAKHDRLVYDGATVPSLHAVAFSREATGKLMEHLRDTFLGERPKLEQSDSGADAQIVYARHSALLNRAVEFASVLAKCNAQMSQFNDKLGNWTVPVAALFPANVKPLPGLVGKSVLLDGRGYGGLGKNKNQEDMFTKVNASVRQMVAAAKPSKPVTGNATNAGQGKDATDAVTDALTALPAGKIAVAFAGKLLPLLDAFHILFVTDAGADAKLTDYSEKERNLLTDIVRQYDVLKNRA
jgi:hypothetical protein